MTTKGDDFVCAHCGQTFTAETPEEECRQECQRIFGDVRDEETVVVCDDCWKDLGPSNHPHMVEEAMARTLRERIR